MEEKRRQERLEFDTPIAVRDALTGEQLGRLGNLSVGGFMVITDRALDDDLIMQLTMEIPCDGQTHHLQVGAHTLWAHQAKAGSRHWVGFEIVDINDEDAALLESLCES